MRKLTIGWIAALMAAVATAAGDPRVENVRARQIPDTKDVEVVYDLLDGSHGSDLR